MNILSNFIIERLVSQDREFVGVLEKWIRFNKISPFVGDYELYPCRSFLCSKAQTAAIVPFKQIPVSTCYSQNDILWGHAIRNRFFWSSLVVLLSFQFDSRFSSKEPNQWFAITNQTSLKEQTVRLPDRWAEWNEVRKRHVLIYIMSGVFVLFTSM